MAQRLRLHPPLPLAAGTLARRRLVSILHPGRLCAAGSSRSSTPDALAPQARLDPPPRTRLRRRLVSIRLPGGELGVGSCPRLALRAAWSPSSSPSCALRADRPLQVVPRPTPLSPARASRLLRLSRALRARRPSRPRGPAPAVHARPRQRLGLGRSALVGDVAAAARREPRRRPDGKSVRSCESSPGAVCCVPCNTVRSHSFGLWCGPP